MQSYLNQSLSRLITTDALKPGLNKDAWLVQKKCGVCGTSVTNKVGMFAQFTGGVKKYNCKFCYKAVCANCSSQRARHPETETVERICNSCCSENFEKNIRSSMQSEIDERNVQLASIRRTSEADTASAASIRKKAQVLLKKIEEVEKIGQDKELEIKAEVIEQTANCSALQDEIDELTKKVRLLNAEKTRLMEDTASLQIEIAQTKESLHDDISESLKETVQDQESHVEELRKELIRLESEPVDTQQEEAEMKILERMIEDSEMEKLRLTNEQDMLNSKLHEARVQTKVRDGYIATLKAQIAVFAVPSEAELEELPDDKDTLRNILERTESEFLKLGGNELIERIKYLKNELTQTVQMNTQINERIGQVREDRLSMSMGMIPQYKKKAENCTLQ